MNHYPPDRLFAKDPVSPVTNESKFGRKPPTSKQLPGSLLFAPITQTENKPSLIISLLKALNISVVKTNKTTEEVGHGYELQNLKYKRIRNPPNNCDSENYEDDQDDKENSCQQYDLVNNLGTSNYDVHVTKHYPELSSAHNEEVFYEASPVQHGFEDITSLKPSIYSPRLIESPDLPMEVYVEPIMKSPLPPSNTPLDLEPLKYNQQVNFFAPLANMIDIEDHKYNDEVNLLYILDHEFDIQDAPEEPKQSLTPKRISFKKLWRYFVGDIDDNEYFDTYFRKYPWARFIDRSNHLNSIFSFDHIDEYFTTNKMENL